MIHIHDLNGCAPAPLAHYLKALGILRLVAEQADPQARGWWEGERFRLATTLDRASLSAFFLERYAPTPMVSPWNKGSGFFYPNDPGLMPVESSEAPRFAPFRLGIAAARTQLNALASADEHVRAIKAESKREGLTKAQRDALRESAEYKKRLADAEREFKRLKADLIPRFRLEWRGQHQMWMDAAMVISDEGDPKFPALLGTGGNDGRLDFTNNFMQRLGEIFAVDSPDGGPQARASAWFDGALWNMPIMDCQSGSAVGQYLPGVAGGANNANGLDSKSMLNPVDFLLMMEGTLFFTAHATRRLGVTERSRAAAPFAASAQGAGYASASGVDESARGEQWMPLWSQPLSLAELKRLFAEGRAQMGTRTAREPLDLARAVARLGVARGIAAFQRYGYIERNGQSNFAVPLGRFYVMDHAPPSLACLDDLDVWLSHLRRDARAKGAPARLVQAERRLADALFAVVQHPGEWSRWQMVLLAMAGVEVVQVSGSGFKAGPSPALRPEWVQAADDGSAEFRLALSFALQARSFGRRTGTTLDSIRRHWLPLDEKKPWKFATTGTGSQLRLAARPDAVMRGRRGIDDAIALVERRLIEATQRGERRLPLQAAVRTAAHPTDLAALLAGSIDLDRTLALARALLALDRMLWAQQFVPVNRPSYIEWPDDAWMAIRLALLPWPLKGREGGEIRIGTDPAVLRRLSSGDAAGAVELALRCLRVAGISAAVRVASVPAEIARLWAAALAFPITRNTAAIFARRLDPNALSQGDRS